MSRLPVFVVASLIVLLLALNLPTTAQDATPGPLLPVTPGPEACTVEPRSVEEMIGLVGIATPGAMTEAAVPSRPLTPIEGQPADADTATAITGTVYEVLACLNAGDILRAVALFTEDIIQRDFDPLTEWDLASFEASPQEVPETNRLRLIEVRDVWVLPDNRVSVWVVTEEQPHPGASGVFIIFVNEDDRWLIDEFIESSASDVATPAP